MDNKQLIVHVAKISGRGQEELAGALVKINSADLHVAYVGDGEQADALDLLVKSVGLEGKVLSLGYVPAANLMDVYAAADAAFIAQTGNDGSARAALEAMACGLPVIGVGREALGALLNPAHSYPLDDRSPTSIAAGLRRWLDDPQASSKGAAARNFVVNQRTYEKEADSTLDFYRRMCPQVER